jgi:hypothetical protein
MDRSPPITTKSYSVTDELDIVKWHKLVIVAQLG